MLLKEIGLYLQQQGLGTVDQDIFETRLPDVGPVGGTNAGIASAIAITEVSGMGPVFTFDGEDGEMQQPRFQVLVRDKDYEVAKLRAMNVQTALNSIVNMHLTTPAGSQVWYLSVMSMMDVFARGRDANNNAIMVCSYQVVKYKSPN